MHLFQLGDFTLSSGRKSQVKIDCDALTAEDIETLAWMINCVTIPFKSVEGIPTGGNRLAAALQKYVTSGSIRHLIVDDVLTTGKSMQLARDNYLKANPDTGVMGFVLFARNYCPTWVRWLCMVNFA